MVSDFFEQKCVMLFLVLLNLVCFAQQTSFEIDLTAYCLICQSSSKKIINFKKVHKC